METIVEPQTIEEIESVRHPRGLYVLFGTEMWERLSYYGMRAILMLYMVALPVSGGLGFDTKHAARIYGTYTAAVYLTPILGGWIADRFLGARFAVLVGGIIIASGHFSMAFHGMPYFYAGLILIVLGTGLLKPNISAMVGHLYHHDDNRRDAGFSIFYMGINLGAFLAPFVCGTLAQAPVFKGYLLKWGLDPVDSWHWGFAAAGVGMVLGLLQYIMQQKALLKVGNPPRGRHHLEVNQSEVYDKALTGEDIKRILAIGMFFLFSSMFWMAFEQAGSSLNLFADQLTRNELFGISFPSSWMQSANPVMIIVLAPLFAAVWPRMGKKEPSSPMKFVWGLLFTSLAFAVMTFASTRVGGEPISPIWLMMTYMILTIGELCLSPVGLSVVTKLAPTRLVGAMMGIWFLSVAFGNYIAGWVAGFFDAGSKETLVALFGSITIITGAAAVILFATKPVIRRLMCGVH